MWHFAYLEGSQGVLGGVPRGPKGPPGPPRVSSPGPSTAVLRGRRPSLCSAISLPVRPRLSVAPGAAKTAQSQGQRMHGTDVGRRGKQARVRRANVAASQHQRLHAIDVVVEAGHVEGREVVAARVDARA